MESEGDYPPLGYLELDRFAGNRLFDARFQQEYRARENMYAIFPRWTRIFCNDCNRFVGQYRKQFNGKSRRMLCISCKKPVCMGVSYMSWDILSNVTRADQDSAASPIPTKIIDANALLPTKASCRLEVRLS